VVRNHEGGTGIGAWRRRSDGSFGSPELTRGRYIGGRDPNPTRGGTNARRFQRSHERSEGEAKAMRAVIPQLRLRKADARGNPRRPGPATVEGQGGPRGRPTTRSPGHPFEKRSTPKVPATPTTLKARPTPAGLPGETPPPPGGGRLRVASRNRSSPPCIPDRLRWHRSVPPPRLRPRRAPIATREPPAPLKRRREGSGFGPLPTSSRSVASGDGQPGEPPQGSHRFDAVAACRSGPNLYPPTPGSGQALTGPSVLASPGWCDLHATLEGTTKPMEETSATSLATAT
jgi:hypothetical protein